jgi:hypothetical protein
MINSEKKKRVKFSADLTSQSSDFNETESFDSNQLPALKLKLKEIAEVETKQDNELDEEEW